MIKIIEDANNLSVAGIARNTAECLALLEKCKPDIILTKYKQRYYAVSLLDCGTNGYLLKNADADEITSAVEMVLTGNTYLSGEIEQVIRKNPENPLLLSPREIEVLKLIAEGFTNKEIATKLYISPLTVDSHRKNLILKMGVRNTASLVKTAGMEGIL